jgi:hypothetical protein
VVRDYQPADLKRLLQIHSGSEFEMPDLRDPLCFVKKVWTDKKGVVRGACILKLCAEAVAMVEGKPNEKLVALWDLGDAVREEAWKQGFDSIHAAVRTSRFDRRLTQMGWSKDRPDWHLWTRSTTE